MNKKALNAMLDFGRASLEFMRKRGAPDQVSMYVGERLVFNDKGHWNIVTVQEPDYRNFTTSCCNEGFWNVAEAIRAARVLLDEGIIHPQEMSDSTGKKISNPTFDMMKSFLIQDILQVVIDYLEQNNTFDFSVDKFKKSYAWYEARWLENTFKIVVTVPLFGFDSEIDRIELPGGFVIEKFDSDEKTQLWDPLTRDMGILNTLHFAQSKFKLCGSYQRERNKPCPKDIPDIVILCITALRLLHSGEVSTTAAFERREPPYLRKLRGIGSILQINDLYIPSILGIRNLIGFEHQYYLASKEITYFVELVSRLVDQKSSQQLHSIDIGLRWFNRAYSQKKAEDKIIALTIALESTLLHKVSNELRFRLALRGAALLREKRKPKDTFSFLKTLYDTRSNIVHNGQTLVELAKKEKGKIAGLPANNLQLEAEQIAREVLINYIFSINTQSNLEKINKELEETIVSEL